MEEQKGLVHIYCGDGKGKTTAALGLALRAAGRGMKVVIARFLKTEDSGEVKMLCQLPGIVLLPCRKSFGFTFSMGEEEKKEASRYYQDLFARAVSLGRPAMQGFCPKRAWKISLAAVRRGWRSCLPEGIRGRAFFRQRIILPRCRR